MRLSRGAVAKWWNRYVAEGESGLIDRSSRPHRSPERTQASVEERICRLRRSTRRAPVCLSARTPVPAGAVWRILQRDGLNRLSCIDGPAGRVIRRHERSSPGALAPLHQQSRPDPPRGGWRVHGRGSPKAKRKRTPVRYTYPHVAIDDHSRVALRRGPRRRDR